MTDTSIIDRLIDWVLARVESVVNALFWSYVALTVDQEADA